MMEENPRDVSQKMDGIRIVYGDESLPRIYEHSRISSDQLPGQLGNFISPSLFFCLKCLYFCPYQHCMYPIINLIYSYH